MSKIQDQIAAAKAAKGPDGKRLYSDDEIYAKLITTEKGKKALEATSPEELRSYLGLDPAPQTPQDPNSFSRAGKMYGGAALEGAGEFVGLPGTLIHLINNLVPEDWKAPDILMNIPSGESIHKSLKDSGLVDRADAQPQNWGERISAGTAKGMGAAVPSAALALATGGASLIPELVSAGGTSGLAGAETNELMPNNPAAEFIATLLGGITGQSLTRGIKHALEKASTLRELDAATLEMSALNGPEQLAKTVAKTALRDATLANTEKQFVDAQAAAKLRAASREAPARTVIGATADGLAPGAQGWQDAGDALRADASNWFTTKLPQELETAWSPVDAKVPGNTAMTLDSFDSALTAVNKRAGSLQPLADILTPSLPSALRAKMDKILEGQSELGLDGFTWQDARTLRTILGDAMRDPKIMPSVGDTNLKQLYAALTQDLSGAAKTVGAEKEFAAANEASKNLFRIAEGPIAKILNPSVSAGDLAKGLAKKAENDAADLETLRAVIPQGVDNLAAVSLRTDQAGRPLTDWTKISPRAKEALIPDPLARKAVDDSLFELVDTRTGLATDLADARTARDLTRMSVMADHKNWAVEQQAARLETKLRLDSAKASAAKFASNDSTAKSLRNLSTLGLGGTIGGQVLNSLGVSADTFANSSLGATAAVGIPMVVHGAGKLAKNPELMTGPLIGVSAGNSMMRDEGAAP